MVSARIRGLLLAVAVLGLSACGEQTLQVDVQLLTQSCPRADGSSVNALDSVSDLEFVITGDGIDEPITSYASVDGSQVTIPGIPIGAPGQAARRLIEVRGHFNGPDGVVTARGGAMVELSTDTKGPVTVPIFMHGVESFVYTAGADSPAACAQMNRPRAGHTSTLLNDGRVLIVGGADYDTVGGRTVHDSAEIYDPSAGTFALLTKGQGGPNLPRAFHTASLLQDGRVLVAGGEYDGDGKRNVTKYTEIFDPTSGTFSAGPLLQHARARQTAATLSGSVVVVAGGYAGYPTDGSHPVPVKSTEYWDAASNAKDFTLGPDLPEPRAQACGAVTRDGELLTIAGGVTSDAQGVTVADKLYFLAYGKSGLSLLTQNGAALSFTMPTGRYDMGCDTAKVTGTDGKSKDVVIMAGGFNTIDAYGTQSAYAGVDVFDPSSGVTEAPGMITARGRLCAVAVDDHTVVFVGGYNSDDPTAGSSAERLGTGDGTPTVGEIAARANDSRFYQACTRLADGSVLITGGMTAAGGSLKSAELYTPMGD